MYECFSCGTRDQTTQTGVCSACGSTMQHIGRSRDL